MFISTTTAIVIDNCDPEKRHRVMVKFMTDSPQGLESESSWCRMLSPMAGPRRGMVMLPDVGTEVLVGFAYRSMTPYILGAVYNGSDLPEPYRNDDCLNNVRVFWSRNDHMVTFDDTEGAEKVGFGVQATDRLKPESAGIHSILDSSQKTITSKCDGDTIIEAAQTISVKCKDFKLEASNSVDIGSGQKTTVGAGLSGSIDGGPEASFVAGIINLNPSAEAAKPKASLPSPEPKHPPAQAGPLEALGGGAAMATAAAGEDQGAAGSPPEGRGDARGEPSDRTPSDGRDPRSGDPRAGSGRDGAPKTDAWDDLRDRATAAAGSAVGDAVGGIAGDLLGDELGAKLGEKAGDLAERAVSDAFDRVEEATGSALGGVGSGRPGGSDRPSSGRDLSSRPGSDSSRPSAERPAGARPSDERDGGRPTSGRPLAPPPSDPGSFERPGGGGSDGRPLEPSGARPSGSEGAASGTGRPLSGEGRSETTEDAGTTASGSSGAERPTGTGPRPGDDERSSGSTSGSGGAATGEERPTTTASDDRPAGDSSSTRTAGADADGAGVATDGSGAGGTGDVEPTPEGTTTGSSPIPDGVKIKRTAHPHPEDLSSDARAPGHEAADTPLTAARPGRPGTGKPGAERTVGPKKPSKRARSKPKATDKRAASVTPIDLPDLPEPEDS